MIFNNVFWIQWTMFIKIASCSLLRKKKSKLKTKKRIVILDLSLYSHMMFIPMNQTKHQSLIEPRRFNHFGDGSDQPPPLPVKKKHSKWLFSVNIVLWVLHYENFHGARIVDDLFVSSIKFVGHWANLITCISFLQYVHFKLSICIDFPLIHAMVLTIWYLFHYLYQLICQINICLM